MYRLKEAFTDYNDRHKQYFAETKAWDKPIRTYSEAWKHTRQRRTDLGSRRNERGGQERGGEQREDGSDLHLVLRVVVGGEGGVLLVCVGENKKEEFTIG